MKLFLRLKTFFCSRLRFYTAYKGFKTAFLNINLKIPPFSLKSSLITQFTAEMCEVTPIFVICSVSIGLRLANES